MNHSEQACSFFERGWWGGKPSQNIFKKSKNDSIFTVADLKGGGEVTGFDPPF